MTRKYTKPELDLIEKHRDWNVDHQWWDSSYDDFCQVAKAFGLRLDGNDINFSGFWCQGDGAQFRVGRVSLADILDAGIKTLDSMCYGPADKFTGYVLEFYNLYRMVFEKIGHHALLHPEGRAVAEEWTFSIHTPGNYCHSGYMIMTNCPLDAWTVLDEDNVAACTGLDLEDFDQEVLKQLRSCADALYKSLEDEYDYLTSNDAVWDMIQANGIEPEEDEDVESEAA